jgi:hypothetical protein
MPISITKSIAASSLPQGQCRNYSPNLSISYWVAGDVTVTPGGSAVVSVAGYYDQAGYDMQGGQPMVRQQITIPEASVAAAIASDVGMGTFLLTLMQFSGGTAIEAA